MRAATTAAAPDATGDRSMHLKVSSPGENPTTSFPASLQPDLERNQDRGQPASSRSKMDASCYFPKWDSGRGRGKPRLQAGFA
jgi:hypothetical protein